MLSEAEEDSPTQTVGPAFYADQHHAYRAWRESGDGVHRVRFPGPLPLEGWLVTGHAACRAALAEPLLSKHDATEVYGRRIGVPDDGPGTSLTRHMLNSDPPDHTRLRRLVQGAYTARRVAALRPVVEAMVGALLDELESFATSGEEVDLLGRFALPLPVAVVFELFGAADVEHEDALTVRGQGLDGGPGDDEVSVLTAEGMLAAIRALVAHKRARPGDDLLSALLAARDGEDRLSEDEVTSMALLLALAGHQTTVNLIANTVHALLAHPDQLAALRADPALLPGAIEETLRFDSPSAIASLRYTTEPVTIGGTTIPAGEFVQIGLLAANRDPAVFADPDRFDITRPDASRHLAFGHGLHHCLGAPLARLQAEAAVGALLDRFPALRPADPSASPPWQFNPRHRGLLTLPVLLG